MAEHGGFDHNAQALRLVTRLERRYATFDGLNLSPAKVASSRSLIALYSVIATGMPPVA
jgi:dGTP triphosphohydrolase